MTKFDFPGPETLRPAAKALALDIRKKTGKDVYVNVVLPPSVTNNDVDVYIRNYIGIINQMYCLIEESGKTSSGNTDSKVMTPWVDQNTPKDRHMTNDERFDRTTGVVLDSLKYQKDNIDAQSAAVERNAKEFDTLKTEGNRIHEVISKMGNLYEETNGILNLSPIKLLEYDPFFAQSDP